MASYPTYDPSIWIGGVSKKQFKELIDSESLSSNAYQGQFAPGSTYKVVSTAAAGDAGFNLYDIYNCPSSLTIGPQTFRNFESSGYGPISLTRALEVSCNTVFYGIARTHVAGRGRPRRRPRRLRPHRQGGRGLRPRAPRRASTCRARPPAASRAAPSSTTTGRR